MKIKLKNKKGFFLPMILLSGTLFLAYAVALVGFAFSNIKMAGLHNSKITAMSIAEAGINYYMWHLAHDEDDYCDGAACTGAGPYGPFEHDFTDQAGNVLGTYELTITPPATGDSTVLVRSTGRVKGTTPKKTIEARLGMPAFSKYALLVNNSQLWVGDGESINGSVFVNGSGMRMDGNITKDAYSTERTYSSWWGSKPGIWTDDAYLSSAIFGGDKSFPVPKIDFNELSVNIMVLRNNAKNNAEGDYYDRSNKKGYHITLDSSNYTICKVNSYENRADQSNHLSITGENCTGNGMGIKNYPADGLIFVEDDLWVEGKVANQKITIVAGDPDTTSDAQKKSIHIPNKILYTNYDGSDKIGLITQKDILLTRNAPIDMEIDAAMIAYEGMIKINDYGEVKSDGKIRVYGSMAHNAGLVWGYASGPTISSGYPVTETVEDPHNILNPPPKFPKIGSYQILSWREE